MASTYLTGRLYLPPPPRQHEFSTAEWWWLNGDVHVSLSDVLLRRGALWLRLCCEREHQWTRKTAMKVLKAYQQFLMLIKINRDWDSTILYPPDMVRKMWRTHASDTKNYFHDMVLLCGRIVQFNHDAFDCNVSDRMKKKTAEDLITHFEQCDVDSEIWRDVFDTKITIKIRDHTRRIRWFKIWSTSKMEIISNRLAAEYDVDVNTFKLCYRDQFLKSTDTPSSLKMGPNSPMIRVLLTDADIVRMDEDIEDDTVCMEEESEDGDDDTYG